MKGEWKSAIRPDIGLVELLIVGLICLIPIVLGMAAVAVVLVVRANRRSHRPDAGERTELEGKHG